MAARAEGRQAQQRRWQVKAGFCRRYARAKAAPARVSRREKAPVTGGREARRRCIAPVDADEVTAQNPYMRPPSPEEEIGDAPATTPPLMADSTVRTMRENANSCAIKCCNAMLLAARSSVGRENEKAGARR